LRQRSHVLLDVENVIEKVILEVGVNLAVVLKNVNSSALVAHLEVGCSGRLELLHVRELLGVEVARDTEIDVGDLNGNLERVELSLLEGLNQASAAVELLLGGSVKICAELCKLHNLTVLGELELEGAGNLLHGLELSGRADTRHGETDVNGWADTLVKELSLQEDLAVSDGDNVGRDVGRHVVRHGLNDWERSHGAASELVGELSSSLKETRVEVENVSGVGLASRWATEEERHLTIGNGLLGQVVIDNNGVVAGVAEILTNRGASVRG